MKNIIFIFPISLGIILCSCKTDHQPNKIDLPNNTFEDSLTVLNDSIKNSDEMDSEQFFKDSIDATKIKSYSIKKIYGKHKHGGITKIEYKSLFQILNELEKESEKEMWTIEDKQSKIELYKNYSKGGQIRLDIERITIGAANTEYFSIIIKNLEEKELWRYDLKSNVPETPISNDYWWNIATQTIDKRIKTPFYVYIVDKLEDTPFKFEVAPVY